MQSADIRYIGRPTNRFDGKLKVTGSARYAAEYPVEDLLYGVIVPATIPAGRIVKIHTDSARAISGVVEIFTHENRGDAAWFDRKWRDEVAPPGHPFRPLHSDRILFDGQPIALVVADTFEAARDAAALVEATYDRADFSTDLQRERSGAYEPPEKRSGVEPPPPPRGDADKAFESAAHRISCEYRLNSEHHNPMELYGTTCVFEGEGSLTIYDKTQGSQNSQTYVTGVFGLKADNVRVINHYVGGAFGSGLRPQHQLFMAVMASLALKRSVRVSLTRAQMFHIGHRPDTYHAIALSADKAGNLLSIFHDGLSETSHYEDYQENLVGWSGMLYRCDNVTLKYNLAKIDRATPCDMRAPGAATGVNVFECAIDELAYAAKIDPLEFRRINYAGDDQNSGKKFTSKELEACYRQGADAIGWARRNNEPRSTRDGHELVGIGMSTGMWEASMMKASAQAKMTADGRLQVSSAASDIGTGTWTIFGQIGADALGLPLEAVTPMLGDSSLPASPVEGGSWTAASNGSAVQAACEALKKNLFDHARKMANSPLADTSYEDAAFSGGRIHRKNDNGSGLSFTEIMHASDLSEIVEDATAAPNTLQMRKYISYTHSAVFAEVRVDDELGVVRIPKIVCAVAAGRIINPKTARSQILGGVVMGIGMALQEESMIDHRIGKIVNHNFAEYHVPAHADVENIEVIFVEEHDEMANPLGVKGLGEIGIVGTAAAIGNAIFNATGKRVRDFPITLDKLIA